MLLLDLPVELILNIADQIDKESDILGLLKCCAHLRDILIPYLYRRNAVSGGGSALPWCSEHGYEQNVERMLRLNVDPETPRIIQRHAYDLPDRSIPKIDSPFYRACNTPLYLAVERGHEGIVKLLLGYKVDLKIPLLVAVSEGCYNPLCVKQKLFQRVPESYERIVQLLLEHGANPNSRTETRNVTALTFAIRCKNLGIVSLLLEYGAILGYPRDMKRRTTHMLEFLHVIDESVQKGDLSIAKSLLELLARYGADLNTTYFYGDSPLHFACKVDHTGSLVRQMIRQGADVNSQTIGTMSTPLHCCTEAAAIAILENGARLDIADRYGNTPLHCATRIELLRLYLDAGADPNWKNHKGESVLVHTVGTATPQVMSLLLERGADINSTAVGKETALHRAIWWGNTSAVRWLIDHGANPNAKLDTGPTPLEYVMQVHNESSHLLREIILGKSRSYF